MTTTLPTTLFRRAKKKLAFRTFGELAALWCRASQDVEDKQPSILESIRIHFQQFWPFRFSNSSEEESRIRPLFKVKIFIALNIWQDYISEISIKEIAILRTMVLIKFTSLFKTHFSLAVAAVWISEIRTSSSSAAFGTTADTGDKFERFADQWVLRFAVLPRGWRTRHPDWWMEDCCCYSQDVLQQDKFQFH